MDGSDTQSLQWRKLTSEDLQAMLVIEQAAHSHPCSSSVLLSFLNRPTAQVWGVIKGQKLLGFSIVSVVVDESELINIAVHPQAQGKGLGRQLLQQAIEQLPDTVRGMFLEVRQSNEAAIALYDRMGFIETGVRKNYYPTKQGRENALLMARDFSLES
ncbi:ribosomal protein S18-alanine N-acetyltransferase [Maricurvus nonylphenolicus]|uniref:ribosomal protein S18-alanine N-acetyltransferase n=1 Tax=Maricurvus nonylphenolicus TaxID=1008307 RepID=UPI0036F209C5